MLNCDFLEEGQVLVSPPHFVYNFLRKMFFMSYSVKVRTQCCSEKFRKKLFFDILIPFEKTFSGNI